ncbi:MAG: pitrilysin family protein [Candidatus Magasanikbacteria bacterium]|jgi:predicted Zn-dependent peptidase
MHKISQLKNGINLITVPVSGTRAITVLALFPVGSRYETSALSGGSHFIEHMMFKGTSRRPNTQAISRELDAAGAEYNAFTSKDHTGYYIKIDSAQSELAFDMLSDMLFDSLLDEQEITKEKGVIVEELRMYEDNPTMSVDSLFDQVSFSGNQLGVDIGGTVESVRALKRDDLLDYYHRAYRPSNMVLVVAGNINAAKLRTDLKYFENIKVTRGDKFNHKQFDTFSWTGNLSAEKRASAKERKLDQMHLILGFPGLPQNHPDRFAQSVLLNILGGTMSSRLFEEVRNKRGLCYMVHASGNSFRDAGTVQIQAGLDPARLPEAIAVIKDELKKIAEKPVSSKELCEAKSNFSGRLVLGMEESSAMADWFAKQFWFAKKIQTYEQVLVNIKKVSTGDVARLAKKLFVWGEARLAVIGSADKSAVINLLK